MVACGLAGSVEEAERLIRAGEVLVDDCPVSTPGARVRSGARVRLRRRRGRHVSRAGDKLAGGLSALGVEVRGLRCLDVGIGTGGFTDCLLQRGAAQVVGVDVAYGEVHWQIRQDPRVQLFERTNFRIMDLGRLGAPFDLVVTDCSFISLRTLMGNLVTVLRPGGSLLALIKPQFELPAARVEPGGRVRDSALREEARRRVEEEARSRGLHPEGHVESDTPGRKAGNVEWLALFRLSEPGRR